MNDLSSAAPSYGGGYWAQTANMQIALDTMFAAINAGEGVPRMTVFYGPSGYGKTISCSHVAAVTDGAYIRALSVWTAKTFLEKLAGELGITHLKGTASGILDQIIAAISRHRCPIIIDEMDFLVNKKSVEMIRDIYDATQIPIMMVGEEALPAKLLEWDRFDNRILDSVRAQPASINDGRLLRDLYSRTVEIADDLADYFTEECKGVARRMVANLQEAQRVAVDQLDVTSIDRAMWGTRPVRDGRLASLRPVRSH